MQLNVGPFQNYLSIVCLDLDMQDYLNAGISIARVSLASAVQSAVLPGVLRIGARPGKFAVFTLKIRCDVAANFRKRILEPTRSAKLSKASRELQNDA